MKSTRIAIAATLLAIGMAGCSASQSDSDGGSAADYAQPEEAYDAQAEEAGGNVDPAMNPSEMTDRQIITSANAQVQVDDPAAAAAEVAALTEALGGRVEAREEYTGGEGERGWASLTVRVPSDQLTGLLESLDDVGTVQQVSQSEDDVTGTVQDLDARIAALETSTERLRQIMADATDTGDLLATEQALSERQADLEALQAQRAYLSDQVAMSTLTVSLETEYAPTQPRGGLLGGLEQGWNSLVGFGAGLLLVLGVLIPWLIVLGVPVAAIVWFVRRRRNRPTPAG
ncbi:MAG: DUF4349 domain-containing protein [Beutenbergiaceae bacterium]